MQFTRPYMDSVLALAVKSKRRDDFSDVEALARLPSLVIGVPPAGQASQRGLQELLADTRARFVEIDTPRRFFAGELPQVDALVMRAEAAAAWTMLYPDHTFVVPQPDTLAVPLTLGLRNGDPAFAALLDNWLVVQQADGALKAARNYWMHGAGARPAHPRWSIRRDVLGW